jgi:hypothetical protein
MNIATGVKAALDAKLICCMICELERVKFLLLNYGYWKNARMAIEMLVSEVEQPALNHTS